MIMERILERNNESVALLQTGHTRPAITSFSFALRGLANVLRSSAGRDDSILGSEDFSSQEANYTTTTTTTITTTIVEAVLPADDHAHTDIANISPDNVFGMVNFAYAFKSASREVDDTWLRENCDFVMAVILYNYAFSHHREALSGSLDASSSTKSFEKALKLYCMALATVEGARIAELEEGETMMPILPSSIRSAILINMIQIHSHFWQLDYVNKYRAQLQGIFADTMMIIDDDPQSSRRGQMMSNDEYALLHHYVNFDMNYLDAFKIAPAA